MAEAPKMTIAFYRGYTHGEFAIAKDAPIGGFIGNWCREHLADKEFLPKGWSWDPIRKMRVFNSFSHWKVKKLFCSYNHKTDRLHLPIGFCDEVKKEIESWGAEVKELPIPTYPLRKIDLQIKPEFKDRPWQVDLIKNLSNPATGMKCAACQMGKGKTYSSTKAALSLGYATIVIAPNSLPKQWYKDLFEKTTAKPGDVYLLEGFDSLATLAKCPDLKPSIFVGSVRTLQKFAQGDDNYTVLPWTYREFFKAYGIGTKIIDEVHLNFHANTLMDLQTNVPYNIYCSATFTQTSRHARDIFNRVFPKEIRYGEDAFDKYVTTYVYPFSGDVLEKKCSTTKGYNHSKYEEELMKVKDRFMSHYRQLIQSLAQRHYVSRRQPGDKLLIICSTVNYVMALTKLLQSDFPDLKVQSFLGGDNKGIDKSSDIIVSTTGKSGTGLDVKGLTTLINTVSMQSETLIPQVFGRLRKIPDKEVVYVDMWDVNLAAHCRHATERIDHLKRMSLKYNECSPNGLFNPTIFI